MANELTDTQRESIKGLKLKTIMHLNTGDGGFLQQRCEEIGLTRIVRTPKVNGRWGEGVVTWVSDADKETEHDNLADAMRCGGIQ